MHLDKISILQKYITEQQVGLVKLTTEQMNITRASFAISALIAQKLKPLTDGEFIKECIETSIEIICPEKKALFPRSSARSVTRRVEDISSNVKGYLKEQASRCQYYFLAMDESTDLSDTS